MTCCPTCNRIIPDKLMVCPVCLEERSRIALRAYQLDLLRKVLAGDAELPVRAIKGKRHIQIFGAEKTHCGQPVSPQHRRSHIPWEPAELNKICAGCRFAVTRLMEEACQPSA
jgi:hypothetical protein